LREEIETQRQRRREERRERDRGEERREDQCSQEAWVAFEGFYVQTLADASPHHSQF
jgi:hypothetical protein